MLVKEVVVFLLLVFVINVLVEVELDLLVFKVLDVAGEISIDKFKVSNVYL